MLYMAILLYYTNIIKTHNLQLRTILIKDKLFGPMVTVIWDKEAFIDTIRNTSTIYAPYSSYQVVVGGQLVS